jgi:hypothetical protein
MKKSQLTCTGLFALILLLWISEASYGQKNEIGFGAGAFNYTGDLSRNLYTGNLGPGGTIFYRRNINEAISIRASLTAGILNGDDTPAFDAFAQRRNGSFSRSLVEIAPVIEYHFLDYRKNINILRWTPYFFVGGGVAFLGQTGQEDLQYSNVQVVLPFGLGFKYVVDRKWQVGLEAGVRKTFSDYLDDVSGDDLVNKNYSYGNRHDNDWYYFLGLSVSYTFYTIPCPYQFN